MPEVIGINIYIDGVKHNSTPLSLSVYEYDVSDVLNPGDTANITAKKVFDDNSESEISNTVETTMEFKLIFNPSDTSISTLLWLRIYKSSDYPMITTSKDYFVTWSTDHDSGAGGLWWGEMDDLEFNGFVELGQIYDSTSDFGATSQAETPELLIIPDSVSGYTNSQVHLYYHMFQPTGFQARQETHLMTCDGGVLHSATWTQRGSQIPFGTGDTHNGYLRPYTRAGGDYVGYVFRSTSVDNPPSERYIVTSVDGHTWVKQEIVDKNAIYGTGFYNPCYTIIFEYNSVRLAVSWLKGLLSTDPSTFGIVRIDPLTHRATHLILELRLDDDLLDISAFKSNTELYIYYKRGIDPLDRTKGYGVYKMPLSRLDSLLVAPTETISNLSSPDQSGTGVSLTWDAPSGTASEYHLYQDGVFVNSTTINSISATGLVVNTDYDFQVLWLDERGNQSPLSATLQVNSGDISLEPEYQSIIDYAALNSFELPSTAQQLKDNDKIKYLKAEGVWSTFDVFWYFEADYNPSSWDVNFYRINWKDPNSFLLTQTTPTLQPLFNANEGIYTPASDNRYCETSFNVLNDTTNMTTTDRTVMWKSSRLVSDTDNFLFGARIANDSNQFTVLNSRVNELDVRLCGASERRTAPDAQINDHRISSRVSTVKTQYRNGDIIEGIASGGESNGNEVNLPIYLLGLNNNSSTLTLGNELGLAYLSIGSNFVNKRVEVFEIMSETYTP